jgi:hypothetical protein
MNKGNYITTIDNFYDPSIDYDAWKTEDMRLGYNSEAYLARIATIFYGYDEEMSDEEKLDIINRSIDDICRYDFLNVYRKITVE